MELPDLNQINSNANNAMVSIEMKPTRKKKHHWSGVWLGDIHLLLCRVNIFLFEIEWLIYEARTMIFPIIMCFEFHAGEGAGDIDIRCRHFSRTPHQPSPSSYPAYNRQ